MRKFDVPHMATEEQFETECIADDGLGSAHIRFRYEVREVNYLVDWLGAVPRKWARTSSARRL